jgi:hypothetical protein
MKSKMGNDVVAKELLRGLSRFCKFCDRSPVLSYVSGADRLNVLSAPFQVSAIDEDSMSMRIDDYYKKFIRPVVFNLVGQIEDQYDIKGPLRFSVVPCEGDYVSETFDSLAITLITENGVLIAKIGVYAY